MARGHLYVIMRSVPFYMTTHEAVSLLSDILVSQPAVAYGFKRWRFGVWT